MTWEEIEREIEVEQININNVFSYLKNGGRTFKHPVKKQEGLVHKCSKGEYEYQFSYFDQYGPIGDFQRNTLREIAEKIVMDYQFIPCSREEYQYIS